MSLYNPLATSPDKEMARIVFVLVPRDKKVCVTSLMHIHIFEENFFDRFQFHLTRKSI